jgi:hypothetical protein
LPGVFKIQKREKFNMIRKAIFAFLAFAVVAQATTVLNESDAGTPAFTADYTVSFDSIAPPPCSGGTFSQNSFQSCNLPANFNLLNGVSVSGIGLEIGTGQYNGIPLSSPMLRTDYLIHVNANQSITFTFASAAQAAGLLVDTDQAGKPVTIYGLTYAHPGGANFAYWLGVTDDTQSMLSLTLTAGPNSGFIIDSLNVKNADPLAPTAEATPMVLVGSGLSLLGWMKRRRRTVGPSFRPEHDITEEGSDDLS